jgi:GGDEF domain-containing protein
MDSRETGALVGLAQRRFQNFSEAADSLLQTLTGVIPGVVVLGRLDPDEQVHRVIEARGEGLSGLSRGAALTRPGGDDIDQDFLRSLGAQDWLSAPLEMTDGRIAGVLCAVDAEADSYGPEHTAHLGIAARLLGHEWESVELRSELRRLRGQVNAGPSTDADTSLPDRDGFLHLLDQEWHLVEEGEIESVLVACRVGAVESRNGNEAPTAGDRLALKLAADVLAGTTRGSDRVGRVAEMTLGAILVGCPKEDAPTFVGRYLGALERVTKGKQPEIAVSCGVQPLAGTSNPNEALRLAEVAAENTDRAAADGPNPEAVLE